MLKSLKNKAVLFFALCFFGICAAAAAAGILAIAHGERAAFENDINAVFTPEFAAAVNDISQTPETYYNANGADGKLASVNYFRIYRLLLERCGELGLNSERSVSVLDGQGHVMYTSGTNRELEPTPAIRDALEGRSVLSDSFFSKMSEYAVPVQSALGEQYIIYVRDTKAQLRSSINKLIKIGAECMLAGLVLAFVFGMILSRLLSTPIKRFNVNARRLAEGDFDALNSLPDEAELAELAETLTEMAHNLDKISVDAKKDKNKLETILQAMSDGVLAFDLQGRLIHINPEAKRIIGLEYLDDVTFDGLFKELKAGIALGDLLYISSDEDIERQITIDDRYVRLNFTTFKLDGRINGIVVVLYDITKLEKLEQSRRNFVADVSHELRTPLTTIKSYAETLADNPDSPPELQTNFLNVISSEADRMVRIISDLLTLSQLDEKHKAFKPPEDIDVRAMVARVTDRMELQARQKQQSLTFRPINEVPIILGDPDGLERVIINIIGNAIKYTPSGGKIDVYLSKIYNDVCIKVSDTGMGIPKENLPHIFDRFYRVDKARSRDKGGTGLGLAIAKQTVESEFGGKITIASRLNKGTDVSIILPLNRP